MRRSGSRRVRECRADHAGARGGSSLLDIRSWVVLLAHRAHPPLHRPRHEQLAARRTLALPSSCQGRFASSVSGLKGSSASATCHRKRYNFRTFVPVQFAVGNSVNTITYRPTPGFAAGPAGHCARPPRADPSTLRCRCQVQRVPGHDDSRGQSSRIPEGSSYPMPPSRTTLSEELANSYWIPVRMRFHEVESEHFGAVDG